MIQPGRLRYKTQISVPDIQQQTDYGDMAADGGLSYERFADIKWLPGSEMMSAEVFETAASCPPGYSSSWLRNNRWHINKHLKYNAKFQNLHMPPDRAGFDPLCLKPI